jgi:hypothetical protein
MAVGATHRGTGGWIAISESVLSDFNGLRRHSRVYVRGLRLPQRRARGHSLKGQPFLKNNTMLQPGWQEIVALM